MTRVLTASFLWKLRSFAPVHIGRFFLKQFFIKLFLFGMVYNGFYQVAVRLQGSSPARIQMDAFAMARRRSQPSLVQFTRIWLWQRPIRTKMR